MGKFEGAVDNWGGHWQKEAPVNPDFSKIGGKPPRNQEQPVTSDLVDRLIESERAADVTILRLMKRIEELIAQKTKLREMLRECEDHVHGELNQRIQLAVKETE